jgi:hypothetical protein
MANEWTVTYGEHHIQVVKTSAGSAHLLVDGELLDATNDLYAAEDDPALVGVQNNIRIDVFLTPYSQVAIRVNGTWIAEGGRVYAAASD